MTIGLVLADIVNPFSAQIARFIQDKAQALGYTVIIGNSDENAGKTRELIELLLNRQVDGLIIAFPENTATQITDLNRTGVPFVLLDRYFPSVPSSYICIDNYAAAAEAVKHLKENGNERIGIITYETSLFHLNQRLIGALDQLEDKSFVGHVSIDHTYEDVCAALESFLAHDPLIDAIFFTSNLLTISGLKYLNQQGVRIPEQLAVLGFDKTDAFELFYTSISYVRQPVKKMGEMAVELLVQKIENDTYLEKHIVLDPELIIKNSSLRGG